jgi:hypothetical protein
MSHLKNLWVAMLTRNTGYAGTNSQIVIIINEDGVDRLHHTFTDTPQYDQEKGQANLYKIDVAAYDIVPDNLDNSSVRVAIRGGDMWKPEHCIVWGEGIPTLLESDAVAPIAIETDLPVGLSTERDEGPVSIPLRRVHRGGMSMQINRLLMLMTTADQEDAGTESGVELQITNAAGSVIVDFEIPNSPQDDQERAQANFYFVPVSPGFSLNDLGNDLGGGSVTLGIKGQDAWLPQSFFLFGLDHASGRPDFLVPLVHIGNWVYGWLSADSSEGESSISLPQIWRY